MLPSGSSYAATCGSVRRSVPRGPVPRELRVHRPTGAAYLPNSGLHRMQILAGFETQKFGGGGRSNPDPLSRTGARPRQAADRSDPLSLAIERDGLSSSAFLYAGERIFMRHHDMWASIFGFGMGFSAVSGPQTGTMRDAGYGLRRIPQPVEKLPCALFCPRLIGRIRRFGSVPPSFSSSLGLPTGPTTPFSTG
jgi:hypothetical protein